MRFTKPFSYHEMRDTRRRGLLYNTGMKKYLILLTLILPLAGCAVIDPLIQDANIVSVPDEVQISQQMQTEVAKAMQIVSDPALTSAVQNIGNRLVSALPQKVFDYQFYVVADNAPNAFTIPGGKIYVHTGLMKFVGDESELAGVLAHEIGHAYERHPAKAITRQIGLAQLSSKLGSGTAAGALRQMALKIAGTGAMNFYSRSDESEADRIGFDLLRKTGYPTDGLTRFLQKLLALQKGNQPPAFLSSHPPTPERIAALEKLAQS